jgi:hypothetical protein
MGSAASWLLAFSAWLTGFNSVDVVAVIVLVTFWAWVWRVSARKNNTFVLSDILVDPYSNRGSGAAVVYLGLAGVAVWYVVRVTVGGGDASNTLVTILTIFIVKAGADRAFSAWGSRDQLPPPREDSDKDQVDTGQPAPPAPCATDRLGKMGLH